MLKKITVRNYKCFEELTFDLSAADYSYNPILVKDGIVNKALIYGKNGTGKTSLGFAIFDLVQHLTDRHSFSPQRMEYYRNLNTGRKTVFFQYTFSFDFKEVVYEYEKTDSQNLVYEMLVVEGETLLDYHYGKNDRHFVATELCGNLDIPFTDNKLSILKYIYQNTPVDFSPVLTRLMHFCDGMLWVRGLSDESDYCGLTNDRTTLDQMLFNSGQLPVFKEFLARNGQQYELGFVDEDGQPKLYAYFNHWKSKALFSAIASSGTKMLCLLFYWIAKGKSQLTFLFIDEFDAFFHNEAAAKVARELNAHREFQTLLSMHNTYLMQNQFTRPDCCFILTKKDIKSLKKSTDRELREAHNLEKMYIGGAFEE
ncbi:MAG: AAA family ATPase [Victivallales bacterium]|nr:AAA family ATPase [Victivallales bacterium]